MLFDEIRLQRVKINTYLLWLYGFRPNLRMDRALCKQVNYKYSGYSVSCRYSFARYCVVAGGLAWGWRPYPGKKLLSRNLKKQKASEEGQGPRRAVDPKMMMMIYCVWFYKQVYSSLNNIWVHTSSIISFTYYTTTRTAKSSFLVSHTFVSGCTNDRW
jgi:hypothetical protein